MISLHPSSKIRSNNISQSDFKIRLTNADIRELIMDEVRCVIYIKP